MVWKMVYNNYNCFCAKEEMEIQNAAPLRAKKETL